MFVCKFFKNTNVKPFIEITTVTKDTHFKFKFIHFQDWQFNFNFKIK